MFYVIGTGISFFLSLLLLSKKNKTTADKILACWIIAMSIHLCFFTLRPLLLQKGYAFLLGFEIPMPLLHGPFLYLYTAATTNKLPKNKKYALLHFITPLLSLLMFGDFFFLPAPQKIEIFRQQGAGYEFRMLINLVAIYASGIFYVVWCSYLLKKHAKNINREFSNTDKINLNWLRYLVYGIGAIWLVILFGLNDNWIFGTVVCFIVLLGFFGIKQVGIFTQKNQAVIFNDNDETGIEKEITEKSIAVTINTGNSIIEETASVTVKKKYSKSGLTEQQADEVRKELNRLMTEKKVFTESEITLTDLASRLNIHPNYLSQVMNEKEGASFYDYINTLRIEEFKRLVALPENKKYTILSLAFECGFNSKSSFNRYFKKVTGLSPSEYMQNAKQQA